MFGMQMGRMGQTGSPSWLRTLYSLFGSGQQGAWYDPSDLTTLFQDAAGTVPVTAMEQPVGRMLDLSGNGNHASQATTTKRGVVSRRVNLHAPTEQLGNAYWTKTAGASVSPGAITSPTGGLADTLAYDGSGVTGSYRLYGGGILYPAGVGITQYIMLRSVSGATTVRIGGNVSGGGFLVCNLTTEWQKFQISGVSNGSSVVQLLIYSDVGNNDPFTIGVWGASCTYTADAHLPYQRVNTDTDYDADPAKFPAYLRFDGVDDALQTGNVDFTGTDKMTVWAGVQSYDLANPAVVLCHGEFGLSSFQMMSPGLSAGTSRMSSAGATAAFASQIENPGTSAVVISGQVDTDYQCVVRQNGIEGYITDPGPGGGGTFQNAPLAIGSTLGNVLHFNGRLYSLIVRGAATPLAQIEAVGNITKKNMRLP